MTKADIVERVYKEAGFSKKEAADLVDLVFKIIKDTLSKGEKVKISGFGNFSIRDKATRVGRNPQTGEAMEISARRVLTFKPSQVLKEDVTMRYSHRLDDKGKEDTSLPPKDGTSRALSSFMSNSEDPSLDDDMDGDDE
ncbi:MAG: integration host factor subunit alpha [Bdellovibrio sp. CG12_big_fil_rev_8_21_14_0_65_39_13]|nr:MAG: integration host factor subunit alpha [Bdellovibrio sp. CG22_combo_CG10-13_8_21_14_all_39_27]PIQ61502.1 MAG: integration host factor subunit alpha [Bdellovibrio sp. CG12_big_fil_rev_8_21_14_0_65_39_13]PIR35352.1 MAG: integration host factor subunit alpha [Bdellovibrio sp. CG11_big_fil_rev_8_21_14_0_20_39_38]PJB53255.1 MAG: integration host factor subunit alpha [Bdellovibrio sp. CG_4_9_14_3_um_filter_39_7]